MNNGSDYIDGRYEGRTAGLRYYDSLPRAVRQLIADAAYPYVVGSIVAAMHRAKAQKMPFAEFLSGLRARLADDVQRQAAHTFGPTHPQAQRVTARGRS